MPDLHQASTPEALAEQRRVEEQRMACVHIANSRAKPDSTGEDIAKDAATIYAFVKGS